MDPLLATIEEFAAEARARAAE
jgi:hypothetical protein